MKLSTNVTDFANGDLGLVEMTASNLNDRKLISWSKPELVVHINDEQLYLASRINEWYEDFFVTSATTPIQANQAYYALPPDLIRLMGIEIADDGADRDPMSLSQVPIDDRTMYGYLRQANTKREFGFFFLAGTAIRALPESGQTSGIVRTHFVKRLTPLVLDDDVSEIPLEHHALIHLGAARRAEVKYRRTNGAVDRLYEEGLNAMVRAIQRFSQMREERVEPFYGSFGPILPWNWGWPR